MPALTKNKKILIASLSVFLVLGAVFVLGATDAKAALFDIGKIAGNAVLGVFAWAASLILWFFSRLIAVAAFLLQAVFAIEDSTGFTRVTIVKAGWNITRGICNMFFALILLLMAFDTILQTNKFQARTILPKLILVALTINFSLVFLGIFIDFSQILTRFFIDAAGGENHSIADQLANSLNIAKVFETPAQTGDSEAKIQAALGGGVASLMAVFGSLALGIIIILIATFAIGAGAIFMLLRLVSLWVLLITAPLAWLAMIAPIPGLNTIVGDWWNKFFKWTFFAPIYAFFIYLAVLAAGTPIFNNTQTPALKTLTSSTFLSSFLSPDNGISLLMQYVVVIILLLTGLQTAQSAGLKGANAVTAWGKKAGDKLKGYAKRPAGAVYDKYANKAVQAAGGAASALGLERFGRRLKAKGVAMETSAESKEQHKAYANLTKTMSDQDLGLEVKSAYGIRKLLAARQAKERGLLDKTNDTQMVEKAMATFGTYGIKDENQKTKEQRDLEDVRFDTITDKAYQEKVILRSKENGNLEKIKPVVLENAQALNAVADTLKHEFDDMYKKWGKKTKDTAKEKLFEGFTADLSGINEIQRRNTYASLTGEINKAFAKVEKDENGKNKVVAIDGKTEIADENALRAYVSGLTASKVAEIRHPKKEEDLKLVGQYASAKLTNDVGRERSASTEQKDAFAAGVKAGSDEEAKKIISESPGWGAAASAPKRQSSPNPISTTSAPPATERPVRGGRL